MSNKITTETLASLWGVHPTCCKPACRVTAPPFYAGLPRDGSAVLRGSPHPLAGANPCRRAPVERGFTAHLLLRLS
jgi:hypothetical protein